MKRNIRHIRRKRFGSSANRTAFIVLTLLLPLLHTAVFWGYVNIDGILLAFKSSRTGEWTLENFVQIWELITKPGGELAIALRNTLLYFLESNVLLVLNLMVAYFLYKKIAGYKTYRIIFYLPGIISSVVLTTIFQEFIKPFGPLGTLLETIGMTIPETGFLADSGTATYTIMAYNIWVGFSTWVLMFSSTLSRMPAEVMEAARLDGCGPFRELFCIVLPMIVPMFTTMFILNFTSIFSASGPILLFTEGKYETTTVSYWMFNQVYGGGGYGGASHYNLVSAFGLCLTVVAVPLTMGLRALVEKIPSVEY